MTGRVARAVFPSLTEPLVSREELRARVGDDAAWEALVERPLGETLARHFEDDLERGIIATDALIGTFAGLDDESLRQNRCFLYHVIGNGTGDWDVPVGGMGAVTEGLAAIAWAAGAEVRLGVEVTGIETDGVGAEVHYEGGSVAARHVLAELRSGRAGAAAGRAAAGRSGARGRTAQAQHAAVAAAEAARRVARPARGVRGHVPRQRVGDPARGRLRPGARAARCRSSRRARSTATRSPIPTILGAGAARGGRADDDVLRAAHAGAAVRRQPRRRRRRRRSRPRCGR